MLRIIRKGKIRTYVHTCKFCGCKFAYNEDDIDSTFGVDRVECPMPGCKQPNNVFKIVMSTDDEREAKIQGGIK